MNGSSPRNVIFAGVLVLGTSLGLFAPASQAGHGGGGGGGGALNKTFTGSISVAGGASLSGATPTEKDVTITLTNTTVQPQSFGSANIGVPLGLSLCSSCASSAPDVAGFSVILDFANKVIDLRSTTNSGVSPGHSVHFTVGLTGHETDCSAGWPIDVKQSNDFSGTGNDFSGPTALSVSMLYFSTQPTDTQYKSDSTIHTTTPVVAASRGCGPLSLSSTPVTVTDSAGQLATGSAGTATGDTATFDKLSWSTYNFIDTLTASASGFQPVTSSAFYVYQVYQVCPPGNTCTTPYVSDPGNQTLGSITIVNSTTNSTAHSGLSVGGTPAAGCGEPTGTTTETAYGTNVTINSDFSKTVTIELPKKLVNLISNNGTPFMNVCLDVTGTTSTFTDKFGQPVPRPAQAPTVFSGLLPDCAAVNNAPPCVVGRSKNAANEYVTFTLKAGDPVTNLRF